MSGPRAAWTLRTRAARGVKPGETTNLVLTVTNTSELAAKPGWSFTDHLPSGLTVAGAATSTCSADVTANSGANAVKVVNGTLTQGEVSCSVTIPVTSKSKGGTFKNDASNIESVGLNEPGATQVEYVVPKEPKKHKKHHHKHKKHHKNKKDDDNGKRLPMTGAPWWVNPWIGGGGALAMIVGAVSFVVVRRRNAAEGLH